MTDRAQRQPVVSSEPRTQRIEKVYMAVTDTEDTTVESVYIVFGPQKEKLPVVAIEEKDLAALRKFAHSEAEATGKPVSIICFTNRELHETFRPLTTGDKES